MGKKERLGPGDLVGIAGGGVGGLALAAKLTDLGLRCVVFERDASRSDRRQGYGITLNDFNKALAGLGILDECRARNTWSHAHWTFGAQGEVLGYHGWAFLSDTEGKSPNTGNLRLPRNELRALLLSRLPDGVVRWGCKVASYRERDDGVDVTLDSGEVVPCAVLVGADGVRSVVRRQKEPQGSLDYLGVVICTGFTELRDPLLHRQGFYTIDGRSRLFTMPYREATEAEAPLTMWQLSVGVESEEEARAVAAGGVAAAEAFVREHSAGWHEPFPSMLDATDWDTVWAGPLFDRKPLRPLRAGQQTRVTVLGDAAHPMSPFKGQGAQSALYDAWQISEWLQQAPPGKALACYEREMITRGGGKAAASREAAHLYHTPAALEVDPVFNGVAPELARELVERLSRAGVGAHLGAGLEEAAQAVYRELLREHDGAEPAAASA